jgi:hypothetical protein
MRTPGGNGGPAENGGPGIGGAAKQVAEHASTLARLEMELAGLELKRKISNLGIGIGLALTAAVFALYALGFGFATVAAALATFLATWLALLIVFGGLLLIAIILGLIGLNRIKRGTPPVPEQAIEEAKRTQAAITSHGG